MRTANDLCAWCAEEEPDAEAEPRRAELPPSLTPPSSAAASQAPNYTSMTAAGGWRSDPRLPRSHRRRRVATDPAAGQTVDLAAPPRGPAIRARPRHWITAAAVTAGALVAVGLATSSGPPDPQVFDHARKPPAVLTIPTILAVAPSVPSPSPLSDTGSPSPTSPPSSSQAPAAISAAPQRSVTVTQPGNQQGTVGTADSLQLKATDSGSGATLTYRATGLPPGLTLDAGTGVISGTATTAGTFTVRVTATDDTGASGTVLFTWSVAPEPPTCQDPGQLIVDPGFESQSSAWNATDNVIVEYTSVSPHSGSWYAWFGGLGEAHTDTVSQQVSLPSGCSTYSLSFWMDVDTTEQGTTVRDTMRVQILDSGGSVMSTLVEYSNVDDSSGYQRKTFDLSGFAGQSVQIKFKCVEDSSRFTSFLVDDIQLDVW